MTQTKAPPSAASTTAAPKTPPAPGVPRTKNLSGFWKLNREESTSPREPDDSRRGGNGGGYPGGGHGGYGGRMHHGKMSDDERKEMQELMRPSETLAFNQDGAAIIMTDDLERHRRFYTDGRKVKKSKDADNQEFDAGWNENRLVSEFKRPGGNKIERTFEVLDGNQQLRETIHFTMGRNQRGVYLRYVYDLNSAAEPALSQAGK